MTSKQQISPQKWEQMRRHYLTGSVTLKELAQLHRLGYSTVRRHASANDWFTHKRSQRLLLEAGVRNNLSERLLEQAGGLQQTAGYCLPMSKEKHYDVLIKLLQLQMKLKLKKLELTTAREESPQPGNVIPLRQLDVPQTRAKLTKVRREIKRSC